MGYRNKTNKEYQAEWREKNRELLRGRNQQWVKSHPERVRKKLIKFKKRNPEKIKEWSINQKRKLRTAAFLFYGGDPPKCKCCGEKLFEFLTIDHIGGGGEKHRKGRKNSTNIYQWLKTNKYPQGFQVLCMNCNWATRLGAICPHQKKQ